MLLVALLLLAGCPAEPPKPTDDEVAKEKYDALHHEQSQKQIEAEMRGYLVPGDFIDSDWNPVPKDMWPNQ